MKDANSQEFLLTINTPSSSYPLQEITAQYGIGTGNAIGNISLLISRLSWSSRFITVLIS